MFSESAETFWAPFYPPGESGTDGEKGRVKSRWRNRNLCPTNSDRIRKTLRKELCSYGDQHEAKLLAP